MGSSTNGIVCDTKGQPVVGLVELKCPNVTTYVDCPYSIKIIEGTHTKEFKS